MKIVNVKQDLIDLVFTQLPDLNSIIQVINSPTLLGQQLQQYKIIKLTALTIIENMNHYYLQLKLPPLPLVTIIWFKISIYGYIYIYRKR